MTTEIILRNLGSYLPERTNYSQQANAFLTNGYASQAGNVYFSAIRLGEGIVVKEDVGHGYAWTFLNGIYIYSTKDKKLLADRRFHNRKYSKEETQEIIRDILTTLLKEAAEFSNVKYNETEAQFAISRLIFDMYNTDQRQMLQQQNKKQLGN
jgi:predicted house-cleaning noncanonical NTP pyrophosphatase (MazG superfamily)